MNSGYLSAVVLNITNKCNLKCLHCFNGSSLVSNQTVELSDDEILELIDQCIEMKVGNICFSGGEPLTRKQLLLKCLKKLKESGIRSSIVSNGTLIDMDTALLLKVLGVAEIEISLDGALPETHERLRGIKGSFVKAVASIKYLVDAGITTSISYTLNSWNGNEFFQMAEELIRLGVYGIYVRPLIVMGTAVKNSTFLAPDRMQYRKIAKDIYNLNMKYHDTEIYFSDPLNHIICSRKASSNPSVEIQADGRLLCSYCIGFSYGNVRRHSLKEYWNAELDRAWQLPAISDIASSIFSYSDLNEAVQKIPAIQPGQLSHCDIIDEADTVWGLTML